MRLFTILLALLCAASPRAQTILDLQECIDLALERNLTLQKSELGVDLAETQLRESRSARWPNMNAQIGGGYYTGRAIDPTTNDFITEDFLSNDLSLSSGLSLFDGGRVHNQIKMDRLGLARSRAQWSQAADNVGLNVAIAYLNVLARKEDLKNARAQLEITRQQLQDLQKLIEAGSRARNDILDLEVQLYINEQNLVAAQNQLAIDKLALSQMIRWEGDEFDILSPDLSEYREIDLEAYSLDQLIERAVATQPVIEAGRFGVEESKYGLEVAKSGYFPSLTANFFLNTRYSDAARAFGTNLEWISLISRIDGQPATLEVLQPVPGEGSRIPVSDQWDQNLGYGVGLTLSIPIFNRRFVRSNVERSQINIEQAELDLEIAKDQLKQDVENAFVAAKNAEKAWLAAQKSLEASEAAFYNTQKKFNVGNATNLELSTARLNYENAQRDNITAKYTYIFNVKVLDFYIGKELTF